MIKISESLFQIYQSTVNQEWFNPFDKFAKKPNIYVWQIKDISTFEPL